MSGSQSRRWCMNRRCVAGFSFPRVWFRRRLRRTLAGQAPPSGSARLAEYANKARETRERDRKLRDRQ
jgi:hypothetical protein